MAVEWPAARGSREEKILNFDHENATLHSLRAVVHRKITTYYCDWQILYTLNQPAAAKVQNMEITTTTWTVTTTICWEIHTQQQNPSQNTPERENTADCGSGSRQGASILRYNGCIAVSKTTELVPLKMKQCQRTYVVL